VRGLYIISGPSGAGKSILCKELVNSLDNIKISISHTTRPPRGNEIEGENYYFVQKESFKKMLEESKFAEWTQIHGNYYGTSHSELKSINPGDKDIILEIEGHGALQIKGQYPMAKTIFILPPNLEILRKRIESRAEDSEEEIDRRMVNALSEIDYIEQFDYLIINDDLQKAHYDLKAIIHSNRQRRAILWPKLSKQFGK